MFQKIRNKSEGFTIIEVMIVLAIAALILVVVLIAIPQLQRNQRNSARQNILGRMRAELDNFAGNNNGNYPNPNVAGGSGGTPARSNFGVPGATPSYFERYLGCTSATVCSVNINDPSTALPMGTGTVAGVAQTITVSGTVGTAPGSLDYATGRICAGETSTTTGASARNYTLSIRLEGGAIFCTDNS